MKGQLLKIEDCVSAVMVFQELCQNTNSDSGNILTYYKYSDYLVRVSVYFRMREEEETPDISELS